MGSINPISGRNPPFFLVAAKKSPLQETAKKVNQLAIDLNKNWDQLAPDEIENKIKEMKQLKVSTPKLDRLIFQSAYPISRDLVAFAKIIKGQANEMLKSHSTEGFKELNEIQQHEVMRQARGGA